MKFTNLVACVLAVMLIACGGTNDPKTAHGEAPAAADFERGPHNGRLLHDGDFALEITIFETGVPPQFRFYAYDNGKPLAPEMVQAQVELHRLSGHIDTITFQPVKEYLLGQSTVVEPHSFDVKIRATYKGVPHQWAYASYEGRTTIDAAVAQDAGVKVERAGPAMIRNTVRLMGRIALIDSRRAQIKARFPGIVRSVKVQQGDRVQRGQSLVVVEANNSMRNYTITAPFEGVVLTRNTNVGDVASDNSLFEIADLSSVWVELHAFGEAAAKLKAGQTVRVMAATGNHAATARIDSVLPLATAGQSVVVRATLPNPEGRWRPGMSVSAEVTISKRQVPLAVRASALQSYRDFTVVYARYGETYEVRMLELGVNDGEWVEVLGGLKPGTSYVTEQSYLIKADIEKSGAVHAH